MAMDALQVEQIRSQAEVMFPKKSVGTAYVFLIFLSLFAAHRFYLGKNVSAIFYMLTLGGLGFWALYDLFTLASQVNTYNEGQHTKYTNYLNHIASAQKGSENV